MKFEELDAIKKLEEEIESYSIKWNEAVASYDEAKDRYDLLSATNGATDLNKKHIANAKNNLDEADKQMKKVGLEYENFRSKLNEIISKRLESLSSEELEKYKKEKISLLESEKEIEERNILNDFIDNDNTISYQQSICERYTSEYRSLSDEDKKVKKAYYASKIDECYKTIQECTKNAEKIYNRRLELSKYDKDIESYKKLSADGIKESLIAKSKKIGDLGKYYEVVFKNYTGTEIKLIGETVIPKVKSEESPVQKNENAEISMEDEPKKTEKIDKEDEATISYSDVVSDVKNKSLLGTIGLNSVTDYSRIDKSLAKTFVDNIDSKMKSNEDDYIELVGKEGINLVNLSKLVRTSDLTSIAEIENYSGLCNSNTLDKLKSLIKEYNLKNRPFIKLLNKDKIAKLEKQIVILKIKLVDDILSYYERKFEKAGIAVDERDLSNPEAMIKIVNDRFESLDTDLELMKSRLEKFANGEAKELHVSDAKLEEKLDLKNPIKNDEEENIKEATTSKLVEEEIKEPVVENKETIDKTAEEKNVEIPLFFYRPEEELKIKEPVENKKTAEVETEKLKSDISSINPFAIKEPIKEPDEIKSEEKPLTAKSEVATELSDEKKAMISGIVDEVLSSTPTKFEPKPISDELVSEISENLIKTTNQMKKTL